MFEVEAAAPAEAEVEAAAPSVLAGAEVAVSGGVVAVVQPEAGVVLGAFGMSQSFAPSSVPLVW